MNRTELLEKLKKEIVIPSQVKKKADQALEEIRRRGTEYTGSKNVTAEEKASDRIKENMKRQKTRKKRNRKRLILTVAAAVLAVGGICLAAVSFGKIGRSTEKQMMSGQKTYTEQDGRDQGTGKQTEVSEKQTEVNMPKAGKMSLEEREILSLPALVAEDQGITVTLQDCIVDNYCLRITFSVAGYEQPILGSPAFGESGGFLIDGEVPKASAGFEFYNGSYTDAEGRMQTDPEVNNYRLSDGTMEYVVTMRSREKGYFLGKRAHLKLCDLGQITEKAGVFETKISGTWEFDWILSGTSESIEKVDLSLPVGTSRAVLTGAEISPVSVSVTLSAETEQKNEVYRTEDGERQVHVTRDAEIGVVGFCMSDGTIYEQYPFGSGSVFMQDGSIHEQWMLNRILDIDEVRGLVFQYVDSDGKTQIAQVDIW